MQLFAYKQNLTLSNVVAYSDRIELFLKYADSPTEPTNSPDKKYNHGGTDNSDRVFLLAKYYYDYKRRVGKSATIFEIIKLTVSLYA